MYLKAKVVAKDIAVAAALGDIYIENKKNCLDERNMI